ncbi:MAG: glycosyl hydrolase 115 family protein [Verrucomicrobiota bacterium]
MTAHSSCFFWDMMRQKAKIQANHAGRRPLLSIFSLLLLAPLLLPSRPAFAQLSLAESPGADVFVLGDSRNATPIFIQTNNDRAVLRAGGDLADDVARVTGIKPAVRQDPGDEKNLVIVGALGQSPAIDRLAAEGKLDLDGVRGAWESFILQVVRHPLPGVDAALVIAGSDRRGTIFGIYQLSEWIGVSPWYWWADVPPKRKSFLALRPGIFKQGPPAVKYRGIFLNDEDWGLRPWASKTFDPETGNIGPKTYRTIFELLLRLRANYIWPAQHPGTHAFNFYPANKEIADLYAIVMGSSHCEQMLRDNIDEWKLPESQYNYLLNRDGVLQYWEQRVRENAKFESIYTLGMRGISDGAMPGGGALPEKAARLLHIIQDQRALLSHWVNTNVSLVPQIFCPYKEVLELYRLAPDLPSDITLVWPDDNYGYIRQFSDARERRHPGGGGVYYHVSYWGRPQDYLWICSTPPALIGEEMSKAYDYGANKVWILNVGDLKPAELDIEFFLKLAWNPHSWNASNTDLLMEQRFARDFGPELAPEMTAIFSEYNRLNFQRKPEHMGFALNGDGVFSVMANGDETRQREDAWNAVVARANTVSASLPAESRDAFFEMLGYSIHGAALMNQKWLTITRYEEYCRRGIANAEPDLAFASAAQNAIHAETDLYNNKIAGGKWRLMMSDDPRDQAVFKMPKLPSPPDIAPAPPKLALAVEDNAPALHFSRLTQRTHFIDIFSTGTPIYWSAKADAAWIRLSQTSFPIDARVSVTIDWSHAPLGDDVQGTIHS